MTKYLALFALVMVAIGIVGCSSDTPAAAEQQPGTAEGAGSPAAAETADVDAVVDATVPAEDDVAIGEII